MQLKVENLSCTRGQKALFQHLNFELSRGEALHVCGPNGSGKSSLLKILCGLITPQEGKILWQNEKDLLYVGHLLGVKNELTVTENFTFVSSLAKTRQVNLVEVLDQLQLSSYQNTLCYKLSAGQRQRVALGRLRLLKASAWILDEPFTFLDQSTVTLIQQWLIQHINAGGLVIFTSHQACMLSGIKTTQLELGFELHGRFF
jgi:heme exporter protein A